MGWYLKLPFSKSSKKVDILHPGILFHTTIIVPWNMGYFQDGFLYQVLLAPICEDPTTHKTFGPNFRAFFYGQWFLYASKGRTRLVELFALIVLMEEILHHLGCMKPCKYRFKLPINWCRNSSIPTVTGFMQAPYHLSNALAQLLLLKHDKCGSVEHGTPRQSCL